MTTGLEKLPDAEGEGKQDRPRLVSVKRTTGTERQRASLFEREARVCDVNSEVQGASSEAAAALIFWFFCIKTKELYKEKTLSLQKGKDHGYIESIHSKHSASDTTLLIRTTRTLCLAIWLLFQRRRNTG